ncbi:hypothetical protein [Ornithinimicrobium pekingense]|nr:hypothetical protein [Ornithinimicrobium pekingense]
MIGWLVLVVTLVVQAVGLYSPTVPGPQDGPPGLDKVGHLVAFAVPAAVAALLGARWVVVALVVHAVVSEPLQSQLAPLRQPDVLDALADLAGIAVGVAVARALRRRSVIMGG